MQQDPIKGLWQQLVKERANIVHLIDNLNLRIKIIDEAIPLLQKATAIDVSSILPGISPEDAHQNKDPYSLYPLKESKQSRILFVLEMEKRAMLAIEIQEIIRRVEGVEKAIATLKSFSYYIASMQGSNEICMGKVDGSNKHCYYILPSFLNEEGVLKPEHAPAEKTWGRLPVDKRSINHIIWQKGGQMKD